MHLNFHICKMRLLCLSFLPWFLRILILDAIFLSQFLTLFDSALKNCVNGASVLSKVNVVHLASDLASDLDLKNMIANFNLQSKQNLFYPRIQEKKPVKLELELEVEKKEEQGGKNLKSSTGILYPTANITNGLLRGSVNKSRSGGKFYSFQGIPYGKSERFQPSVLNTEKWKGIRDARTPGPPCMQRGGTGVTGSEDCHYLNVHYPHKDYCGEKLPVILYLHGGSFLNGDGSGYSPKYFIDECVVFLSVNYRLGALGFLCSGDEVITGNFGLYDSVTALQWVKQNIENFRGDPDKVTIMGLSAGSSMVSHLMVSPMAENLFHRGICQSGTVLNPWSVATNPRATATTLAQKLGCSTETTKKMGDCLKGKSAEEIVLNQSEFINMDMTAMTIKVLPLGPVVQSWENETRGFQTKDPRQRYSTGNFNRVPLIAGSTRDEGISIMGGQIMSDSLFQLLLNVQWSKYGPSLLMLEDRGLTPQQMGDISTAVWDFYLDDEKIGEETREQLINLCSDRGFNMGIFETLEYHSQFADAYGYTLSYRGGRSTAEFYGYETPQVTHSDDVPMVCSIPGYDDEGVNEDYQRVGTDQFQFSKQLVHLFSTFADTGKPEGAQLEPVWNKIQPGVPANHQWYELNLPNRVIPKFLDERSTFWRNLSRSTNINQPLS